MRFYVSPESIFPKKRIIEIRDKKEIHHIRDVMRLREGAGVDIFDGCGRNYPGDIKKIEKGLVVIEIKDSIISKEDLPYKLTLYQAIPKRSKIDLIVEKAVELGAATIVPMITERTLAVPLKKDRLAKRQRWMRIAGAAAKQCGRTRLPEISDIRDFKDAISEAKGNKLVIFAALAKGAKPLKSILKDFVPAKVAIFVGPEGDFSDTEISMARKEGYMICSLGSAVLRVETAAIYLLSCLHYEYRD